MHLVHRLIASVTWTPYSPSDKLHQCDVIALRRLSAPDAEARFEVRSQGDRI